MEDSSAAAACNVADIQMSWGVRIPLRDGIHLSATLYLPPGNHRPSPTIFTLTPYIGQTYHDQALYFAARGFPFLTVDVRGRGDSDGEFKPNINEAKDGHDIVEWLGRQPYCNGQVSMWGGSYAGYAQWATAKEFPPHLATIVPVASPCFGVDFPMNGNIKGCYLMKWLTLVRGRTSQDKLFWSNSQFWNDKFRQWFESGTAFQDLDSFLGQRSATFQEWVAHPRVDQYWDSYNPTPQQYAKLSVPILTITGIYDGDQPGALAHYRRHLENGSAEVVSRHFLVIGPWDHGGTRVPTADVGGIKVAAAGLVDLQNLHVEWYRWTMLGGPKPAFLQANVAYYVMGAEKWRYVDTLDAITVRAIPYFLQSTNNANDVLRSGMLDVDKASGEPDHFVYDPRDVSLAAFESTVDEGSLMDQRMTYACVGRQLVYHSLPFDSDREVSGFFRLSAWLSIDQPDTDFRVAVYEIAVDGSAVLLTTDSMRARYRNSLREEHLVADASPLLYEFCRFNFVSRLVRKASRLRLIVGPSDSIYVQKNYNSGGVVSAESMRDARPVLVKLFHDESHPSALRVPFGASTSEQE